jgi:hypothetical protein
MEILDRDFNLHQLSKNGPAEKWDEFLGVAQLEDSAYMIKFQVNRRNELRYTPLHIAIFSRFVFQFYCCCLYCSVRESVPTKWLPESCHAVSQC